MTTASNENDPEENEFGAAKLALGGILLIALVAIAVLAIGTEDADLASGVGAIATGALTVIGTIIGVFGGHRLGSSGRQKSERLRERAEELHDQERKGRMREALRGYMLEQRLDTNDRDQAIRDADQIAVRLGLANGAPEAPRDGATDNRN